MKKEIKKTKLKPRKKAEVKRDQYTVVLEDVRRQFGVMKEGFSGVREDIKRLEEKVDDNHRETNSNFKILFKFRNEMTDFKNETNNNFKVSFEYLSKIDDRIQVVESEIADLKNVLKSKADLDRLMQAEKEIVIIKRELACCREQ